MTNRDDEMLGWLSMVRVADVEAIRWAMAAFSGSDHPVSVRMAQMWVARMVQLGMVGKARPGYHDGSIVWPTYAASGKPALNVLGQTVRHEVAVAGVSARYMAHGYTWRRDAKPRGVFEHQADGIATRGEFVDAVEVELTPKMRDRYKQICEHHAFRLLQGQASRIVYLSTADAARVVAREADRHIFRTERPRLVSAHVFDARGRWEHDPAGLWDPSTAGTPVVAAVLPGAERWEEAVL